MGTFGFALRVLRDEGLASLVVRSGRWAAKRCRRAWYAARVRAGVPPARSPVSIIAPWLQAPEAALLEAVWQLAKSGDVRVVIPDYLISPLASIQTGNVGRIEAIGYSELNRRADVPFDAICLQNGLLHRVPLEVLDEVLHAWPGRLERDPMALFVRPGFDAEAPPGTTIDHPSETREALVRVSRSLRELAANGLLYKASYGAVMRCHFSDMEIGIIEHAWSEYFGWGVAPEAGDVIVDIGANIGAFSVACALRSQAGAIYAFEPCTDNFKLLEENIERNCPGAVTAIHRAVHRDNTPKTLYLDPEQSGGHSFYGGRCFTAADPIACSSLAEVIDEIGRDIDILKIDAEGSEYEILFSCGELVRRRVRTIVMEAHRCGSRSGKDMVRFLTDLGFSVQSRGDPNLMLILAQSPQAVRAAQGERLSAEAA